MNKKVLSLCAGLLLGGSAFNFASADQLKQYVGDQLTTVKDAGAVFFVMDLGGQSYAYGLIPQEDGSFKEDVIKVGDATDDDVDFEDIKNYLWNVSEHEINAAGATTKQYVYALTNAGTGQHLCFDANGKPIYGEDNKAFDRDDKSTYIFLDNGGTNYVQYVKDAQFVWGNYSSNPYLRLYPAADKMGVNTTAQTWSFYKNTDMTDIEAGDLNELYNSVGFNLIVGDKNVDNIFAKQRIKAIQVKTPGQFDSSSPMTYGFPAGTYFVTETPSGTYENATDKYAYLMDCQFIVVSPSVNDINDAASRKAGKGFQLTTISGRELNKYVGTDASLMSKDAITSVYNACFTVSRNLSKSIGLSLNKFRYNETTTSKEQKEIGNVVLAITDKVGDDHTEKYLTTSVSATPNHIFTFEETFSVAATEFLKENAKAVYTFKFVSGEEKEVEESEYGKYLYAPAWEQKIYAKGAALIDRNLPESQWMITKVDGYNVTFTNRANNRISFTTKLYKEEDGAYSLAVNADATNNTYEVVNVLDVDKKGDIDVTTTIPLHQTWVELEEATTSKFAGTWNVKDETEVTLLFARDIEPSSNKLYATSTKNGLVVENSLANAVQFELVKSKDSTVIATSYAYKAGEDVKYMNLGDTIAFYTYSFKEVKDGVATGKYFNLTGRGSWSNPVYDLTTTWGTSKFIIKDNVDGSVLLIPDGMYNSPLNVVVEDYENTNLTIKDFKGNNIENAMLSEEVNAKNVKTYLNIEAPEVSLPTTYSYVTIQSDLGNYISMNDERDAILALTDPSTIRVFATDTEKLTPSFYITTGWNEDGSRMFLFNPSDSVDYYVAQGTFNKKYQWSEGVNKVIFKNASLVGAANDTLSTEIKGEKTLVASKADDNQKVQGGLDKFKYQIILAEDEEDLYWIRQNGEYLTSVNGKLTFSKGTTKNAVKVYVTETSAPTANEEISTSSVVVAGVNGAVVVKGAEGKNVIVSTILGKVVANETIASDNAQIAAPAGIVVVSVDGESYKVVVK